MTRRNRVARPASSPWALAAMALGAFLMLYSMNLTIDFGAALHDVICPKHGVAQGVGRS